jgi:hypothetical protein
MSVYYNQDITNREKDKRQHDLIAALREGPTQLGPDPELATIVDSRGTSTENAHNSIIRSHRSKSRFFSCLFSSSDALPPPPLKSQTFGQKLLET